MDFLKYYTQYQTKEVKITQANSREHKLIIQPYNMDKFNYDLLSEIIFTNEKAFTDIDIEKAKMILCICKNAKNNTNIQISFDKAKVYTYFKQIRSISIKKGRKMVYKWNAENMEGDVDLKINEEYSAQIANIIAKILKENSYIVSQMKRIMIIEQKMNKENILISLKNIISIIESLGINMENITDDDRIRCNNNYEYTREQLKRVEIITIFKYNAYFINMMFNNNMSENEIIEYISKAYFHDNWYRLPIVFTKWLGSQRNLSIS